jgi:hypothetical protein
MALQTVNQFDIGTDFSQIGKGIAQGVSTANQFQLGKQNREAAGRQATQFDQDQSIIRAKALNQAATALKSVPVEQRASVFASMANDLKSFNIDPSVFEGADFSDLELNNAIAQTQSLIGAPAEKAGFKLGQGQTQFDAAGQEIASVAPATKPPATTSLEKNLIAAGFTPGTPEFQAEVQKFIEKPTGTTVSIGGSKKFKEKVAESHAKTFGRIGEEADAAIDANQSLSVLENIDVNTGALEPAKQALASFGMAFGLDTSGLANVSAGEGFNAEAQRIVLAVKASQKGPQTDKDEVTIRETVSNLGNTKAGNQFIIDSARALNNRRIERKGFYDNFIEEAGGDFKDETGKTADRAWSEFKRNTPMISSNLRTPEGLPVFFYRFEESVRAANPDASRIEIIEAWKSADKGAK